VLVYRRARREHREPGKSFATRRMPSFRTLTLKLMLSVILLSLSFFITSALSAISAVNLLRKNHLHRHQILIIECDFMLPCYAAPGNPVLRCPFWLFSFSYHFTFTAQRMYSKNDIGVFQIFSYDFCCMRVILFVNFAGMRYSCKMGTMTIRLVAE
jgi:hypothetical protein